MTTPYFRDGRPEGICVWYRPKVTLLAVPMFVESAERDSVRFLGVATDGERLSEFAGRVCYMSQENPAEKSTNDYLQNILTQRHGSVLEHLNISVFIEGVSRSLTHELVRHRAGFAYSQLSQRYVGPEHLAFVMPPLVEDLAQRGSNLALGQEEAMLSWFREARDVYLAAIDRLQQLVDQGALSRAEHRKAVQQTARSVLPNATETKIVVTGNARAWRHVLELRGQAEPEIRRLAVELLTVLMGAAPHVFGDFKVVGARTDDGYANAIVCTHSKV